jgi:hypothetical protein
VVRRALARRKPQALPDAEQGWREGETVRDLVESRTSSIRGSVCGSSTCGISIRQKALSGCRASRLYRRGVPESSGSQVILFVSSLPQGGFHETAHRAVRRPTRACLRVTTRASEAVGIR